MLVRGLGNLAQNNGGAAFAEDIAQEALLKILGSLDSFQGRSRFTSWALAIAMRVGISELRRRRYRDVSLDAIQSEGEVGLDIAVDHRPTAPAESEQRVILETLKRLIDQTLTKRQQFAVRAALEGLPVEEIARRAGSNRNAIYKLVHDARLKLRQGFEDSGFTADDIQTLFA